MLALDFLWPPYVLHPKEVITMDNPYLTYRHVGFSLDQFLKLTKEYPSEFMYYCEILITKNGIIFLASPSHEQVERWLRKKRFREICRVWYDYQEAPSFSHTQKKILNALEHCHLIVRRRNL